jgi:hypothetical protein
VKGCEGGLVGLLGARREKGRPRPVVALVVGVLVLVGGYFIFDSINNLFDKLFKTIIFEKNIVQIFLLILLLSHFLFQSTLVYALAGEEKILFSLDTDSSKIVNENEILAGEWITEKTPRNIIVSNFDSKHKIELADPEVVLKTEFYYYQWWEGLLYQGQYAYVNTNDLRENPEYIKLLRDDNKVYDNKLSYIFSGK